jgi:hypothetical protein
MRSLNAIGFVLLAIAFSRGATADYDFCSDAANRERRAKNDISQGRLEDALEALAATADIATGTGDDQRLRSALLLATTTNLKLDKPLMAHAWAQATLTAFKGDPEAIANLEAVKRRLGNLVPSGSIAGTYLGYAGRGQWSEFKVVEPDSGKVRVRWLIQYFGKMRSITDNGPTHMLEQTAEGQYADDRLVVTYRTIGDTPCTLTFKRTELVIVWVWPRPADLPENCVFDSLRGRCFPGAPFRLWTPQPPFSNLPTSLCRHGLRLTVMREPA